MDKGEEKNCITKKSERTRASREKEPSGKREGESHTWAGKKKRRLKERENPWCGCRMDSMMKHRMTQGKKRIQWVKYENSKMAKRREKEKASETDGTGTRYKNSLYSKQ